MSYQVGASGGHQTDNRFKLGASAESEATQQKSKASCHLLGTYRPLWWCVVLGSNQGKASRVYQAQTGQDLAV